MNPEWMEATETYEWENDSLLVRIAPYGKYHGITGLMCRRLPYDLVRPGMALLNAEYYIAPGFDLRMRPRMLSLDRQVEHTVRGGEVILRFPPEPDFALHLELAYRLQDEGVDLRATVTPTRDVPGFELFFASYLCEGLDETWVPLQDEDGSTAWRKLDNRQERGDIFGVMRDREQDGLLSERYPQQRVAVADAPFQAPILVARDARAGIGWVLLCQPGTTKYLAGQHHGWDTAHDWAFGADLVAGQPVTGRVRMVCCDLPDTASIPYRVDALWQAFMS